MRLLSIPLNLIHILKERALFRCPSDRRCSRTSQKTTRTVTVPHRSPSQEISLSSVCRALPLPVRSERDLKYSRCRVPRRLLQGLRWLTGSELDLAIHKLLKDTFTDHERIIFNGNGYTDEWLAEAEKRGLPNFKSTPEALPHFIDEKNIELFTKHEVFTKEELFSVTRFFLRIM